MSLTSDTGNVSQCRGNIIKYFVLGLELQSITTKWPPRIPCISNFLSRPSGIIAYLGGCLNQLRAAERIRSLSFHEATWSCELKCFRTFKPNKMIRKWISLANGWPCVSKSPTVVVPIKRQNNRLLWGLPSLTALKWLSKNWRTWEWGDRMFWAFCCFLSKSSLSVGRSSIFV